MLNKLPPLHCCEISHYLISAASSSLDTFAWHYALDLQARKESEAGKAMLHSLFHWPLKWRHHLLDSSLVRAQWGIVEKTEDENGVSLTCNHCLLSIFSTGRYSSPPPHWEVSGSFFFFSSYPRQLQGNWGEWVPHSIINHGTMFWEEKMASYSTREAECPLEDLIKLGKESSAIFLLRSSIVCLHKGHMMNNSYG